jgi:hypothetical protein
MITIPGLNGYASHYSAITCVEGNDALKKTECLRTRFNPRFKPTLLPAERLLRIIQVSPIRDRVRKLI